jgi:hypothetical protein
MTNRHRGWIAAACVLAIPAFALTPAWAADDYTVKDSTGATITIKAKEVSSKKLTTHTVADSAGALIDPATSDKQDTGNTSLGSIDTKLTSQATAAKQDTGNTSLGSIDTKATSTNTKLDTLITAVGTPASATKQDTGNASLSSIDGKATTINTKLDALTTAINVPALSTSGVTAVTGTFTGTGNGSVFAPSAGRPFNLTIYATGATTPGSGLAASVYLARSIDGGTTYLPMTAAGGGIYSFTSLANESLYESQTGVTYRLICTSYTSGTVNYRFAQ